MYSESEMLVSQNFACVLPSALKLITVGDRILKSIFVILKPEDFLNSTKAEISFLWFKSPPWTIKNT